MTLHFRQRPIEALTPAAAFCPTSPGAIGSSALALLVALDPLISYVEWGEKVEMLDVAGVASMSSGDTALALPNPADFAACASYANTTNGRFAAAAVRGLTKGAGKDVVEAALKLPPDFLVALWLARGNGLRQTTLGLLARERIQQLGHEREYRPATIPKEKSLPSIFNKLLQGMGKRLHAVAQPYPALGSSVNGRDADETPADGTGAWHALQWSDLPVRSIAPRTGTDLDGCSILNHDLANQIVGLGAPTKPIETDHVEQVLLLFSFFKSLDKLANAGSLLLDRFAAVKADGSDRILGDVWYHAESARVASGVYMSFAASLHVFAAQITLGLVNNATVWGALTRDANPVAIAAIAEAASVVGSLPIPAELAFLGPAYGLGSARAGGSGSTVPCTAVLPGWFDKLRVSGGQRFGGSGKLALMFDAVSSGSPMRLPNLDALGVSKAVVKAGAPSEAGSGGFSLPNAFAHLVALARWLKAPMGFAGPTGATGYTMLDVYTATASHVGWKGAQYGAAVHTLTPSFVADDNLTVLSLGAVTPNVRTFQELALAPRLVEVVTSLDATLPPREVTLDDVAAASCNNPDEQKFWKGEPGKRKSAHGNGGVTRCPVLVKGTTASVVNGPETLTPVRDVSDVTSTMGLDETGSGLRSWATKNSFTILCFALRMGGQDLTARIVANPAAFAHLGKLDEKNNWVPAENAPMIFFSGETEEVLGGRCTMFLPCVNVRTAVFVAGEHMIGAESSSELFGIRYSADGALVGTAPTDPIVARAASELGVQEPGYSFI